MQSKITYRKRAPSEDAEKLLQIMESMEKQLSQGLDSNEMAGLVHNKRSFDILLKKVLNDKMSELMQNAKGSDKSRKNVLITEMAELVRNKKNLDGQLKKIVANKMGELIQDKKNFDRHLKESEIGGVLEVIENLKNHFKGSAYAGDKKQLKVQKDSVEHAKGSILATHQHETNISIMALDEKALSEHGKALQFQEEVCSENIDAVPDSSKKKLLGPTKAAVHPIEAEIREIRQAEESAHMGNSTIQADVKGVATASHEVKAQKSLKTELHIRLSENGTAELSNNRTTAPSTHLENPMVSLALTPPQVGKSL